VVVTRALFVLQHVIAAVAWVALMGGTFYLLYTTFVG